MKAKSKVKAKAAGKAKAAASKAPGVTSSPMKAQKAKAKSTMKKILTRPDAAEGESQGQSEDWCWFRWRQHASIASGGQAGLFMRLPTGATSDK